MASQSSVAMAAGSSKRFTVLTDLPSKPHQPTDIIFSERSFGKTKVVQRSFQASWLKKSMFLTNAILQKDFTSQLQLVCEFYGDDLDRDLLQSQLLTFCINFQATFEGNLTTVTIFDVLEYFRALSISQRALQSQVCKVLQLVVVMPSTNATSERSFRTLR